MNIKLFIFVTIFLFTLCVDSYGQSSVDGYSVGIKVGTESFDGIYVEGIDLNYRRENLLFSAGYNYNRDSPILQPFPRENYQQANLLFGSFLAKKWFRFDYQGGLGVVWGKRRTTFKSSGLLVDTYNSKEFVTIGIPIKGSIKYIPFKFMSLGFDILANVNAEKSFIRPMATLNFGRLSR